MVGTFFLATTKSVTKDANALISPASATCCFLFQGRIKTDKNVSFMNEHLENQSPVWGFRAEYGRQLSQCVLESAHSTNARNCFRKQKQTKRGTLAHPEEEVMGVPYKAVLETQSMQGMHWRPCWGCNILQSNVLLSQWHANPENETGKSLFWLGSECLRRSYTLVRDVSFQIPFPNFFRPCRTCNISRPSDPNYPWLTLENIRWIIRGSFGSNWPLFILGHVLAMCFHEAVTSSPWKTVIVAQMWKDLRVHNILTHWRRKANN